ncbi:MAG TPA: PilN domain-containing protein [Longimicrobiales bacterium]|nr:PilN domain-containing protein [Longimicrobiales bacterium]
MIAAGLLELWGLGRELEAVRAERTALADRVAEVMAQRDALRGLQGAITALDSLEMTIPVWSGLVTEVARHLPDDAHLAALRGERDSVAIEGVALEAARVFAALRDVPGVSRVVARAPIRREQEGPRAVERFSLAARVRQVEEGGGE